ncbi:MAG TPA: ABC transporter ATP-binding protein [Acidimicrobiia bacterium]|nr:ABC transporter ATP-binding protein [Acidimicrobiia bacterium]
MTWGLDRVTVRFGDIEALSGIRLDVEPGEVAIVVGADGAGKTTLCRTIVGLEQIVGGEVLRPARTGYQPESSGVWNDLTVVENLEFVAGAYGLGPARAAERIGRLLEVTALGGARDRLGGQLSGGMRQKLGVAMAVLSDPELLVLDEPTTGLDPVSRLELWSFISLSAGEGKAIVVTTTYTDEAQRGHTVLVLDSGRELASGTVAEVIAAMPGALFQSPVSNGPGSWRRGPVWRTWSPNAEPVPGAVEVRPDLADVVTVAALAAEDAL